MAMKKSASGALLALVGLATLAMSVAILVIVQQDLWYGVSWGWYSSYYYDYNNVEICFMAPEGTSINVCAYTDAVAGLGLFGSLFILFLQICAGRGGRAIPLVELLTCLVSVVWWIAGATTMTVYAHRADDANLEQQSYRHAVWGMSWAILSLWVVGTLVSLKDCISPANKYEPSTAPQYPHGTNYATSNAAYQQPTYTAYGQPAPPPGTYYPPPPQGAYAYPPPQGVPQGAYAYPQAGAPPAAYPPPVSGQHA